MTGWSHIGAASLVTSISKRFPWRLGVSMARNVPLERFFGLNGNVRDRNGSHGLGGCGPPTVDMSPQFDVAHPVPSRRDTRHAIGL
jgi:hypothetical protein